MAGLRAVDHPRAALLRGQTGVVDEAVVPGAGDLHADDVAPAAEAGG